MRSWTWGHGVCPERLIVSTSLISFSRTPSRHGTDGQAVSIHVSKHKPCPVGQGQGALQRLAKQVTRRSPDGRSPSPAEGRRETSRSDRLHLALHLAFHVIVHHRHVVIHHLHLVRGHLAILHPIGHHLHVPAHRLHLLRSHRSGLGVAHRSHGRHEHHHRRHPHHPYHSYLQLWAWVTADHLSLRVDRHLTSPSALLPAGSFSPQYEIERSYSTNNCA